MKTIKKQIFGIIKILKTKTSDLSSGVFVLADLTTRLKYYII